MMDINSSMWPIFARMSAVPILELSLEYKNSMQK